MQPYDIPQLRRQLENLEDQNDAEAQKLYNNLGLAYFQTSRYRQSLNAHRKEKAACKRLVRANPHHEQHNLDLAIAYRRCGDVMLKLDRLVDANQNLITEKSLVIRAAHVQHKHALHIANAIRSLPASVERQAASAAVAQSALALALEMKIPAMFRKSSEYCMRAARLIDNIEDGVASVSTTDKHSMTHGLALNYAIALSGLGEKSMANTMLHAVALHAKRVDDNPNLLRSISNLAEEAGDDDDWKTCVFYARKWVQLARHSADKHDESDALRKLAVALRETQQFKASKEALERAILIAGTKAAADEARDFLHVIEQEIYDRERMQRELAAAQRSIAEAEKQSNFVDEAKATIAAGNLAFSLKKWSLTATILQRYFVLVDEFGCNTALTDIPDPIHNSAVANVGESMWRMKKYEQAVKWASRELSVFDGDNAGQAQAWCNLGVYLDDFGKKHKAVDALKQSMFFAEKAGDIEIFKRAQANLELVEEDIQKTDHEQVEDMRIANSGVEVVDEAHDERENSRSGALPQGRSSVGNMTSTHTSSEIAHSVSMHNNSARSSGQKSVIVTSNQPAVSPLMPGDGDREGSQEGYFHDNASGAQSRSKRRRRSNVEESAWSRSHHSYRSHQSHDATTTAERSSIRYKKAVDLVTEYKRICGIQKLSSTRVQPRIVSALRSVSSVLIARDVCDEDAMSAVTLNLSRMFLNNSDISAIFKTISKIGDPHSIELNLSLNPTVTASAYNCLDPQSYLSPSSLCSVKKLDISCSGVSANAVRILADALSEKGSLSNVSEVNVSKNGLGRQSILSARAVSELIVKASRVQEVDLSMNLLPNTFMKDLVGNVKKLCPNPEARIISNPVRKVSFVLNNRRYPTAMLDVENCEKAAQLFAELLSYFPRLEIVDVRACGASDRMRRLLKEVNASKDRLSQTIVTISERISEGVEWE